MAWAPGAGARGRAPPPLQSPPSQSPSPPPPAAFLRGAGQPCERLRVGSPHKCVSRSAVLEGRPVALATSLCGELVFPPPALKLARLARLAPVAWVPRAPSAHPAPPALAVTLLVRVWLLLPALPALSDACGRRLLFLELRRRAAEGRLRGSRAQLRALSALARRADALREDHAHDANAHGANAHGANARGASGR
ncbi:Tyrosine-protein phosphatase non-receptor type 13, partial [Gryllus bimaculatus]